MTERTAISLGYGSHSLDLPASVEGEVLYPPAAPSRSTNLNSMLVEALSKPIGKPRLASISNSSSSAVVIVSDASRDEPRTEMFAAVRAELSAIPDERLTIAVANGTHTPKAIETLGLPNDALVRHRVVNHDSRDESCMVDLGRSRHGTRARFHKCLTEADLVVVTGRIKPHYFGGYGGGAKGIFPGLGHNDDIRFNHRLKADPASSLGRVDGNPCRNDLEEVVSLLPAQTFLLDIVEAGGVVIGAVAGDVVAAHRAGVELCRPYCEVAAAPADIVVVSAPLPVSGSLYQASKLIPPAGILLKDGGVVILAAECPDGTGPLDVVNEGIFALGVRRYLPSRFTLLLVSGLDKRTVAKTFCRYSPSIGAALDEAHRIVGERARTLFLPDAGDLVPSRVFA